MQRVPVVAEMTNRETLEEQLSIRLSSRDLARLEAVAKRFPMATRNAVARTALQVGMEELEKKPSRALRTRERGTRVQR